MARARNHQMIVNGNSQGLCRIGDSPGQLDIIAARRRVPAGVVVHQDDRTRLQLQRPLHDLARIGRRLVHRSLAKALVADQDIAVVQEKDPELLRQRMRQPGVQIIGHSVEIREHRAVDGPALKGANPAGLHELQRSRSAFAKPFNPRQFAGRRGKQGRQVAELGQQFLGQRLRVAPGNGERQDIFEQLVIVKSLGAAGQQALPQPVPMAGSEVVFGQMAIRRRRADGRGPWATR